MRSDRFRSLGLGGIDWQSREAATELVNRIRLITSDLSPLWGSIIPDGLTQGSQSLTLGLTLAAAPRLVEDSLTLPGY
jgi:hypothetical protein